MSEAEICAEKYFLTIFENSLHTVCFSNELTLEKHATANRSNVLSSFPSFCPAVVPFLFHEGQPNCFTTAIRTSQNHLENVFCMALEKPLDCSSPSCISLPMKLGYNSPQQENICSIVGWEHINKLNGFDFLDSQKGYYYYLFFHVHWIRMCVKNLYCHLTFD